MQTRFARVLVSALAITAWSSVVACVDDAVRPVDEPIAADELPLERTDPRAQIDPALLAAPELTADDDGPVGATVGPIHALRHDLTTNTTADLGAIDDAVDAASPAAVAWQAATGSLPVDGIARHGKGQLVEKARTEMIDTTSYPARAAVKLFAQFTNGVGGCSGTLVGARWVITAAHCVYQASHGGYASVVTAVPGLDHAYAPFGWANGTSFVVVSAYTNDKNKSHDYALITLDRSIGNAAGWMGMAAHAASALDSGAMTMTGYPGVSWDGSVQVQATGHGNDATSTMVYYSLASEDGFSGTGVRMNDTITSVSAINTRSGCYDFPLTWSDACGVRLTGTRINSIVGWMNNASGLPLYEPDQTGWSSLGGFSYSNVSAVKSGASDFDLVVRVDTGRVWRNHGTAAGNYSGWTDVGGGFAPTGARTGQVAAVSRGSGLLDLFILGGDNAIWTKSFTGGSPGTTWPSGAGWSSLGGYVTDAPAAVSSSASRLDIFVRGGDGLLYWQYWAGAGWSGWIGLGAIEITGAPTAQTAGASRVAVVARRASDGALVHFACAGSCTGAGNWQAPVVLDGAVFPADTRATLVSTGTGKLDVFIRGFPGDIWHAAFRSGAWQGWESLGGVIQEDIGATRRGSGIDLFVRGTDDAAYSGVIDASGVFAGWWWLGGGLIGSPTALSMSTSSMDVFFRDSYNTPRTRHWSASDGWAP